MKVIRIGLNASIGCAVSLLLAGGCDDATETGGAGGHKISLTSATTATGDAAVTSGPGVGGATASGAGGGATCGDGVVDPGEDCDDVNRDDADGCKQDCTFTCVDSQGCSDGNACTFDACDPATHTCSNPPDATQDGDSCSTGLVPGSCQGGLCIPLTCGDGTVDLGEECDASTSNGPDTGCEIDCQFSCDVAADCNDGEPCNGAESCGAVTIGKACAAGAPMAEGAPCGAQNAYCKAGVCTPPVCGNGVIEAGEVCDPPDGVACSATCQTVVCGDGQTAGNEQCDDGNLLDLDGCNGGCRYETVMRWTKFTVHKLPPPAYCVHQKNAFAQALSQGAVDQFNNTINSGITGAQTNTFVQFLGLDDLTGANDATVELGIVSGTLDPSYPGTWTAGAIDGWFLADPNDLTGTAPNYKLTPASVINHVFVGGPSQLSMHLQVGTIYNTAVFREAKISGVIDTAPAPNVPAPPPASLAPGLTVFQSFKGEAPNYGLCGGLTVASLATMPVPEELTSGIGKCLDTCPNSKTYTPCPSGQTAGPTCNSMLDVIVGGCRQTFLCVTSITPTQPDVGTDGSAPAPLVNGAGNKVTIVSPTDAYTAYMAVDGNRTHLTNNVP